MTFEIDCEKLLHIIMLLLIFYIFFKKLAKKYFLYSMKNNSP